METLTVYETILYSALLRLPRRLTYKAKVNRVFETMEELGISHIANRRVGGSGKIILIMMVMYEWNLYSHAIYPLISSALVSRCTWYQWR